MFPLPYIAVVTTAEAFDAVTKGLGANLADSRPTPDNVGRVTQLHDSPGVTGVYIVTLHQVGLEKAKQEFHEVLGIIVHEATHLSDWMLEGLGVEVIDMEVRAYVMQFLTVGLIMAYQALVPKAQQFGGAFRKAGK